MSKKGFNNTNSVTLRLFPGMKDESASFEVVKVSGNPTTIDIDALVDQPSESDDEHCCDQLETFDGYFPEDGYDYTQHLRDINPERFVPVLRKPTEKAIDKRNKELSELMAALNAPDGADLDELDGSFVQKLGPLDEKTKIGMLWGEDQVEEYLSLPTEKLMALNERLMEREKRAESSMQQQGDKEFEAFFEREFNDQQIGGLTSEDVEFDNESNSDKDDDFVELVESDYSDSDAGADAEDPEQIRLECLELTKRMVAENASLQCNVVDLADDMSDVILVPASNVPEWDCESVLSTRSNIFNHPGMIMRPKREPRVKVAVIPEESEPVDTPVREVSTFRKKGESADERRERKKAVKEFQRDQRELKKGEKEKMREQVNREKLQISINKRMNFGDIPSGVPKFVM